MAHPGQARAEDLGAAAVEYGLLLACIATTVLVAVSALGDGVSTAMDQACDAVAGAQGNSGTPPGQGRGLATAPGLRRRGC